MTYKISQTLIFPSSISCFLSLALVGQAQATYNFTSFDSPNATATYALTIHASGQVLGAFRDATGNTDGFVYANGANTNMDDPNAAYGTLLGTYITSINSAGETVGNYFDTAGNLHAYFYNKGNYTTLEYPATPASSYSSGGGSALYGINDNGQMTGIYYSYNGNSSIPPPSHNFIATKPAVPLPSAIWLFLSALPALALVRLKPSNAPVLRV